MKLVSAELVLKVSSLKIYFQENVIRIAERLIFCGFYFIHYRLFLY